MIGIVSFTAFFLQQTSMANKIIIYQIFTRLFGNTNFTRTFNGSLKENGSGKMNFFDDDVLRRIRTMGVSHVWFTGVLRHASATDYSSYGIPRQHPAVVKGKAGSPYAICDYYDIDPDLAEDVPGRMREFEELLARTHKAGMKVVIDFVPNHVARQYHSIAKPEGVDDLGANDNVNMHFSASNNFYYCPGQRFAPAFDIKADEKEAYCEYPAKATGNDRFDAHPDRNDWYETVKLNYGVDYCDLGGRSEHFSPVPDTWKKMTDILLFWAAKGVDAFRCDMAEMVPYAFWSYATTEVKRQYPNVLFIGEVYNPSLYRTYIGAGFDYLYDKVGMYDTMRNVMCAGWPTTTITNAWQSVDDINDHMLYFLENHDEQRIASDFFAADARKGVAPMLCLALMRNNPLMVYAGQEYGERGMDTEGFSGRDGRTTIFDYWNVDSLYHAFVNKDMLTAEEKTLHSDYQAIMRLASEEKAVTSGLSFDLMYVNRQIADRIYAFMRKSGDEVLLVVANFGAADADCDVCIPAHATNYLQLPTAVYKAVDLLSGDGKDVCIESGCSVALNVPAYGGRVYKFKTSQKSMNSDEFIMNEHNKDEFPPAHTAEHLLNQTMIRMFGCGRSNNAHIERKKSKMSYVLDHKPTRKEEKEIESRMNELIADDLPVTYEFVDKDNLPQGISVDKLPGDVSQKVRLVRIGDYDVCPCIGKHVRSTAQIGRFELLGTNWDEASHTFRVRFKIV